VENFDFSNITSISATKVEKERIEKLEQKIQELKEELNSLKQDFEEFKKHFD
jgi:molecular chaperone GrpE (heat shock protein)